MIDLIETYTIGYVATVRSDGKPAVSPKATFLVLDDRTMAFANIRSQATVDNIQRRPEVEVDFIDVFARVGCRVRGLARYAVFEDFEMNVQTKFKTKWPDLYDLIQRVVTIDVTEAENVSSPSYDVGAVASQLTEHWLRHYAIHLGFGVMSKYN